MTLNLSGGVQALPQVGDPGSGFGVPLYPANPGRTEAPGCRRELAEPGTQMVTELFLGSWSGRGMQIERDKQVCAGLPVTSLGTIPLAPSPGLMLVEA